MYINIYIYIYLFIFIYIYTVYDRIFCNVPAKNTVLPYIHHIPYMVLANPKNELASATNFGIQGLSRQKRHKPYSIPIIHNCVRTHA